MRRSEEKISKDVSFSLYVSTWYISAATFTFCIFHNIYLPHFLRALYAMLEVPTTCNITANLHKFNFTLKQFGFKKCQ